MSLESGGMNEMNEAFAKCETALRLRDTIDPFTVFAELDDVAPVAANDEDE
jgi:hypothetical protein